MSKLYKIFFIFIICVLFILNISIFFYNQEIISYFKINIEKEDVESIKSKVDMEYITPSFDSNRLESPKFIKLKDFSVDLSDFDLPDHLIVDDDIFSDPLLDYDSSFEDDQDPSFDDFPEFEVGNINPFKPF